MFSLAVCILICFHQVCKVVPQKQQFQILETRLLHRRDADEHQYCDKDWYPFGDICYKLGGNKMINKVKWESANERCGREGGSLATINSQEIQDFVSVFLQLPAKRNLWIGLHDRVNESSYEWLDGSEFDFTSWEPNEPSGIKLDVEDCVEMVYMSKEKSGDWNDVDCNRELSFVCQKDKANLVKKPPNPMFCSEDEKGWKLGTSCYYLVPDRQTWNEAEAYCQKTYQGHLVTIKDAGVEEFIDYVLRTHNEEFWIGIQIKDEWQQQWSSGWYVAYDNWEKDKKEFRRGTCVMRVKRKEWQTVPCTRKYSFVCETSNVTPPAFKPSVENAVCPSEPKDWRDLGGDYCYYFCAEATTWYEAHFICMRRGGALASFHSQLETEVIHPFMKHIQPAAFIGLYRQRLIDEDFTWADGTPMDFKLWDAGEPNSADEHCAEMRDNMKWNDIACDNKRGFICAVKKFLPNATKENGGKPCICPHNESIVNDVQTSQGAFSSTALIAYLISALLVALLLGVVVFYLRHEKGQATRKVLAARFQSCFGTKSRDRSSQIVITEDSYCESIS